MTCVIVGAVVVSCLIDPATRPTPAEAARILGPLVLPAPSSAPHIGPQPAGQQAGKPFGAPPLVLRPLNCCAVYVHPAPYPRIDVNILHSRHQERVK